MLFSAKWANPRALIRGVYQKISRIEILAKEFAETGCSRLSFEGKFVWLELFILEIIAYLFPQLSHWNACISG